MTTRDLIQAAARKKERDSQPRQLTPEQELNKEKFEYSQAQDLYKRENPESKPPKALTSDQAKAKGFYSRMIASQGELDRLGDFDPTTAGETVPAMLGNWATSKEKQQHQQAADDWIRAKLRKESGAVIGADEMQAEYDNYFPVFGDSKEVISQKARARKVAEAAMRDASGPQSVEDSGNDADIEDGYRYIGGPKDQASSWVKV